ncbi:MAG TPA: LPS assembly lipoprotein LptE [Vicinamibacterales bacterium]|jgi:hypothetical protein
MRRFQQALCLAALLIGAGAVSGCGYTLAGRGSFLPAYIRVIGIPTFANHTSVFNVEQIFTQKVRAEFIGRGRYEVKPTNTDVDAVLTGEVNSISIVPVSFTGQQQASRYTITVVAKISLFDTHQNKELWSNPAMQFQEDYEATSGTSALDPAAFFGQQGQALERISDDFARTVVTAILEAF